MKKHGNSFAEKTHCWVKIKYKVSKDKDLTVNHIIIKSSNLALKEIENRSVCDWLEKEIRLTLFKSQCLNL